MEQKRGGGTTTVVEATRQDECVFNIELRPKPRRSVKWTEDVVDNECLGKKKSKKCCIYHKPRPWDESSSGSSDESNKSDNEAESEADANSLTK